MQGQVTQDGMHVSLSPSKGTFRSIVRRGKCLWVVLIDVLIDAYEIDLEYVFIKKNNV